MIKFKILKKSGRSLARVGVIETQHGKIETPAFVPVATQGAIKALLTENIEETGSQVLICNTFHLHLKPGEDIVKKQGGLHNFSGIKVPLITDSGGFQVFSLGFGQDFGFSKIDKQTPLKKYEEIGANTQPKNVKIEENGVWFNSPVDGRKIFLGPKESIKIQEKLGADIIFAFDECTPPRSTKEYVKSSLEKTHRWARECLRARKSDQALFGIIQGSYFQDLREQSAKFIGSLPFDGYGIGGDLGVDKNGMRNILKWTIPFLDEKKPRHLLGIGSLEDLEDVIKLGVDTFDCIIPTNLARHGAAFIGKRGEKIDLKKSKFLKDKKPLDKDCKCFVCKNHSRAYISHLIKHKEISGLSYLTFHNLYFFNNFVSKIREKIKNGKI